MVSLAFFIPLLIGTGGNVGSQTVTTLVRAMGVGEVQFRDLLAGAAPRGRASACCSGW